MEGNGYVDPREFSRLMGEKDETIEGAKIRIRRIGAAEMLELGGGLDLSVYLGLGRQNRETPTLEEATAHGAFLRRVVVRGMVKPVVVDPHDAKAPIAAEPDGAVNVDDIADEHLGRLAGHILVLSRHSLLEAQKVRPS